jgi:dephospho-CoA kinase
MKESAILFESNTHTGCDKIICVTASESIRIARVIKRDNTDKDHVKSIISSQMNQDKKIKSSDFIIKNNDSDLILSQVISIINSIK